MTMGLVIGRSQAIARIQKRVLDIMPQRYQISKPVRVMQPSGTYKIMPGTPLTWHGETNIPCRLDMSMHYSSSMLFAQEDIINQFVLNVPYDAPLLADYTITIDGETFDIQKLLDVQGYLVAKQAIVSRTDLGTKSDKHTS